MPKQPLFNRQQPGGFNDYLSVARHPGNIWFVGSTVTGCSNSVGTGYGYGPDAPFATLLYALTQCTASQGDVIYLLPNHVETVTATPLAINVAGIAIRGIGEGILQPVINLTTAITAAVNVTAASVTFENISILAGFEDITAAVVITGSDCTFRNCKFLGDLANTHNAIIWISDGVAATDRITIEDCYFSDMDASTTHCISLAGTGTQHVIRRNKIVGHYSTWALGGAGAIVAADISDNYIYNVHASSNNVINFAAATTGVCMNNRGSSGQASIDQITATGLAKCENYAGVIGDSNGPLEPIAT